MRCTLSATFLICVRRELCIRFSIAKAKVSPMIAMSMFRKIIIIMKVASMKKVSK